MIAVFITFVVILLPWWIGYTIVVFGRVAAALLSLVVLLGKVAVAAGALYAIKALTRRNAPKRADETNVVQFRKRG
jgi:hypothetical protein